MALDPITSKAANATFGIAKKAASDFISAQLRRRGSMFEPAVDPAAEKLMDEALAVLSGSAWSATDEAKLWFKAVLSDRPSCFAEPNARWFVEQSQVIALVKAGVRKHLAQQPIEEETKQAAAIFSSLYGGDHGLGDFVFESAVRFVLKSLVANLDASDQVLVEVVRESLAAGNSRLDEIVATTVSHGAALASLHDDTKDNLAATADIAKRIEDLDKELKPPNPMRELNSRLFGVPEFTRRMLPRSAILGESISKLTQVDTEMSPRVAIVGQGGSGKSTIAALIVKDEAVIRAFPDGVFWISLGQNPEIGSSQAIWLAFLSERPLVFPNTAAATAFMRAQFQRRRSLLIIDDVWNESDLRAFDVAGQNSATLLTTRERRFALDAHLVHLAGLGDEESVSLLRLRGAPAQAAWEDLHGLASILDNLPLAIELAAYQLRSGTAVSDLTTALATEINLVGRLAIPGHEFETDEQVARNQSLEACLNLSMQRMPQDLLHRFVRLSVAKAGSKLTSRFAARLWGDTPPAADHVLRQLWSMSLIEAARETDDGKPTEFRFHSVIRAKGLSGLADGRGKGIIEETRESVVSTYLRRANPNFPKNWHEVEDDGNLLDNLIHYLSIIQDEDALRLLLTQAGEDRMGRYNCWQALRASRQEHDAFGSDIVHIHEYFRALDGCDSTRFDGLVRSYLAAVSLSDMNRDISPSLGLALLRSGLWTEGQLSAHARRRYPPGNIVAISRQLAEPLRTATLRSAVAMISGMRPHVGLCEELVRVAEIFPPPERGKIALAAIRMANLSLSDGELTFDADKKLEEDLSNPPVPTDEIPRTSRMTASIRAAIKSLAAGQAAEKATDRYSDRFTAAGLPIQTRIDFLRAALFIADRIDAESLDGWLPIDWVDKFLMAFERLSPVIQGNGIKFANRTYWEDRKFDDIYIDATIDIIETLIVLASSQNYAVQDRAIKLAQLYLKEYLASSSMLDPLRVKILALTGTPESLVRDLVLSDICRIHTLYYADVERTLKLCPEDGFSGYIDLIYDLFGDDYDFAMSVVGTGAATPAMLGYLEKYLGAATLGEQRDQILDRLAEKFPETAGRLLLHQSVAPAGTGNFAIDPDRMAMLGMLVRSGVATEKLRNSDICGDLKRISSNRDRIAILELVLPSIDQLDARQAAAFCRSFGHLESAVVAWLATGSRVDDAAKADFLVEALRLVESIDPATFLAALSRYIGSYSNNHAVQLARVAATVAAGIGDADPLRRCFASSSLELDDAERSTMLRSALWYRWSNMPTHAPIEPIPISRSLVPPTRFDENIRLSPSQLDDASYEEWVCRQLATVPEDRSRVSVCDDLAGFAIDFALRGRKSDANIIANAIFDTAHFYR